MCHWISTSASEGYIPGRLTMSQHGFLFSLVSLLAWAHNSDIPKIDRLEFTAGMGGLMALFRHIASRQTASLDLSHWWCDTRLLMAAGSGAVCSSTSRHCLWPHIYPFASPAWIRKRSRVKPPLYDYLLSSLRLLTAQAASHFRDDSAPSSSKFFAGGFSSVVDLIRNTITLQQL